MNWIVPTSQAPRAVPTNSRILVEPTGTPTFRAALGSPPAAKIQLPTVVRDRMIVPRTVTPSHQNRATGKAGSLPTVPPKMARALSVPGGGLSTVTTVLFAFSASTRPTETPRRTKNVASVTMKLGSLLRTTRTPLNSPTRIANTRDTAMHSQIFQPNPLASRAIRMAHDPVMTPAERSNSPPIISMATGTAMMPNCQACVSHPTKPA